ncbi:hypothetical protein CMI46_00825, partial [Candidatus Pacearchaeota archaeon]|nr:hypothetical protein [Candidatus Pacearchaeota archaeon]
LPKAGGAASHATHGAGTLAANAQGTGYLFTNEAGSIIPVSESQLGQYTYSGTGAGGGSQGILEYLLTGSPQSLTQGLVQGVTWGAIAYMVVPIIGDLLGLEEGLTEGLQYGFTAGLATARILQAPTFGLQTATAGWIGLGVGVAVFIMTYKETKYEVVSFDCQPWEAPIGGSDCEKCHDGLEPCSEYRCKSLGQACGIINEGTSEERCVWLNERDVKSPAIRPWEEVLTEGYDYNPLTARPSARGTEIVRIGGSSRPGATTSDCIEAFTPIEFGIQTDKPAQCKIDFDISSSYVDMTYYFGGSNIYDYNHSQVLNLPSPGHVEDYAESIEDEVDGLEIQNDGKYNFFVRCQSANGYYNRDPYLIHFCVDEGQDTTPPVIEEFSIKDGSAVQFEVEEVPIIVYTNEPATCRWSRESDLGYDAMVNEMTNCATSPLQMEGNFYYACYGTLTGLEDRKNNKYYFKCGDQPWLEGSDRESERTPNSESRELNLRGTQPLNIKPNSVRPFDGEVVEGATSSVAVGLEVETENGESGVGTSTCYYSTDGVDFRNEFQNTTSHKHFQRQDLPQGTYDYYYRCVDSGGNLAVANTTFSVVIDRASPQIVRILESDGALELITDEDAECYYATNDNTGCNFNTTFGTRMTYADPDKENEHFGEWNLDDTYYVRCIDDNGKQPNPDRCSIVVKPVDVLE